jgi:hypothetical protein
VNEKVKVLFTHTDFQFRSQLRDTPGRYNHMSFHTFKIIAQIFLLLLMLQQQQQVGILSKTMQPSIPEPQPEIQVKVPADKGHLFSSKIPLWSLSRDFQKYLCFLAKSSK